MTSRRDTFMARASLFASPVGGSSSAVPKKKVAREGPIPVFAAEESVQNIEEKRGQPKQINQSMILADVDDVEPMEVDDSVTLMPSPEKAPENVPCTSTKATTPRRKSMPTPGKRLYFSSKEMDDEVEQKSNDTTHLELLMANKPEDMPDTLKAAIMDKKEMSHYLQELHKEIGSIDAIKKSREAMLQKARELAASGVLSSTLPPPPLNLNLNLAPPTRRPETADETVRRLYTNFAKNTHEVGEQKLALKKAENAEKTRLRLESQLKRVEEIKARHAQFQQEIAGEYEKEAAALEETSRKIDRIDMLINNLQPIPLFLC